MWGRVPRKDYFMNHSKKHGGEMLKKKEKKVKTRINVEESVETRAGNDESSTSESSFTSECAFRGMINTKTSQWIRLDPGHHRLSSII